MKPTLNVQYTQSIIGERLRMKMGRPVVSRAQAVPFAGIPKAMILRAAAVVSALGVGHLITSIVRHIPKYPSPAAAEATA